MEQIVWSTESVAERERFAFWREVVLDGLLGAVGERFPGDDASFQARVTGWRGRAFMRMHYQAEAHMAFRRPRDIAQEELGRVLDKSRHRGHVGYDIAGREFFTRSGDLTVAHSDLSLEARSDVRGVDFDVWIIPRASIEPHLPARGGLMALTLPADSQLKALVTNYIDAVSQHIDALSEAETEQAADVLARLVGVACGAAIPEHRDALRTARLEQIKRYLDLHLSDIDLTPVKVAKALGISVRSLHLAFEPTGRSFAEYADRRRVQECRAALERPAASHSVTDVAFAWGFANLTTFYRAFRREFGIAPTELRPIGA